MRSSLQWMRSSLVVSASDCQCRSRNSPASSDTVESEGRQMKQCWIQYIVKKSQKIPLFKYRLWWSSVAQAAEDLQASGWRGPVSRVAVGDPAAGSRDRAHSQLPHRPSVLAHQAGGQPSYTQHSMEHVVDILADLDQWASISFTEGVHLGGISSPNILYVM